VHVGVLRGSSAFTLPKELNNVFFVPKIIRKERDTDKEREIDREKEIKRERGSRKSKRGNKKDNGVYVQGYVGRENANLQGNNFNSAMSSLYRRLP
jgi:hypothetical protein